MKHLSTIFLSAMITLVPPHALALDPTRELSPALTAVLAENMELLTKTLAHPSIIAALKGANEENKKLSPTTIKDLDARWMQSEGISDFVKPYLTNASAQELLAFQDAHDSFSEIFFTDIHGLNVAQTNKTSDLYQADEAWWTTTWNEGKGKRHYGAIEYDESAHTEAIAIYVPIADPATGALLGVAKAVLDITSIARAI